MTPPPRRRGFRRRAKKSWGHRLRAATPGELVHWITFGHRCTGSGSRCKEPPRWLSIFLMNRGGKVTDRRLPMCDEHAAEYAEKHGLDDGPRPTKENS